MSIVMDEEEMKALAGQLAKTIKTEKDLNDFSRQLKKMTVEAALGAEMEAHLGYAKHAPEGQLSYLSFNIRFFSSLIASACSLFWPIRSASTRARKACKLASCEAASGA